MKEVKNGLSVIVPVYNEAESIEEFYIQLNETLKRMQRNYEIILVDDGSLDESLYIMKEISRDDTSVKVISLERNFGQTVALACGIDHSKGFNNEAETSGFIEMSK